MRNGGQRHGRRFEVLGRLRLGWLWLGRSGPMRSGLAQLGLAVLGRIAAGPALVLIATTLAAGGCANEHPKKADSAAGKVTPQMRSGSRELRTYQLIDWVAPDDKTLIVNALDRSLFQAKFKGQCNGLRLVDTIAFIVQTPRQVDKYAGVVLPDGKRCAFTSMTRIDTALPDAR